MPVNLAGAASRKFKFVSDSVQIVFIVKLLRVPASASVHRDRDRACDSDSRHRDGARAAGSAGPPGRPREPDLEVVMVRT